MKRNLQGAVVVLTGASSGIGRAAALLFAARGAKLVLAARDREALEDVARECRDLHRADVRVAPTDIRDELGVDALAGFAIEEFGQVDVWVNDAGVYMLGTLEACPSLAVRELIDTNVMGTIHGSRAALAAFRMRGTGVIINVGSVGGKVAYAEASAYCASKHAVHAFTDALRQELRGDDIHACLVVPATVDTPIFQHAANYTGRKIRATGPMTSARRVARAIVECAERPRREVVVGPAPRLMAFVARALPWIFERFESQVPIRRAAGELEAPTSGNFATPQPPHRIDGGWHLTPPKRLHH